MTQSTLDAKIDNWKEQLIDLTRRNSLVDCPEDKRPKTKTLPVRGTAWETIAEQLAAEEDIYVWQPTEAEIETAAEEGKAQEDIAPEPSELPDNVLLSKRTAKETANSLYNISLNQRKHVQEKGVDSLYVSLGMLEWQSVDYSDTTLHSPLFLASVSIDRETVGNLHHHDYIINYEDDVILNPALRKKLRDEFDISIPDDEQFDIDTLNETTDEIERLIEGRSGWHINDTSVVGIFDFAKLGLFNDLEDNREAIKSNPVVRALNGDPSGLNTNTDTVPDADSLDATVDPVDTYQVLEADSSQQEAIEAAKAGMSFVLQGPPGTGKSQTIANIIAEKLADGENILFVSEKEAALNVVKNRLDDVGLGRFCLQSHGRKANKDRILSSLESELNASRIKPAETRAQELGKLRKRRTELNRYGTVLTTEFGALEARPYDIFGKLSQRQDIPSVSWTTPNPLEVDAASLDGATDVLQRLEGQSSVLDEYDTHPWKATTLTEWRVDTSQRMEATLNAQRKCLNEMQAFADRLEASLGIEFESAEELPAVIDVLEQLNDRPELDWKKRFFEEDFYLQERRLMELAELNRSLASTEGELERHYEESLYSEDGRDLHTELAEYGLSRYVSPSYRQLKRQILSHADEEYAPDIAELREDTKQLMERQSAMEEREAYEDLARQLGPLYDGTDTEWDHVHRVQQWVERMSESDAVAFDAVRELVTEANTDTDALLAEARSLREDWRSGTEFFRESMNVQEMIVDGRALYAASLSATAERIEQLAGQIGRLQEFLQLEQTLAQAEDELCASYVDAFLDESIAAEHLTAGFEKEFYTDWLNAVYDETKLGEFNSANVERTLEEFRRLDERQQELAKVEIQHRVTSRRPEMDLKHATSSQQVVLRREIEKERRRKPLRVLFDEAGEMITRLKPCFMMSPLAVAQYHRTDSIDFDAVIFDEASQIMPQDAISSIIRADQVIVAGDTKQLPPTTFFSADSESTDEVREDLESILDEAATTLPEKRLRWHYRSRSEDLIEFSNKQYYAGRLNTFPENDPSVETGVEFVHCDEGVYDRGGSRQNVPEANRIVDIIEEYAEDQPEKTLGVVAFSSAQERAIRDVLEDRRQFNRALDQFIDEEDSLKGFFVKNLEAVQGDERDVMVFSVGYGPDQSGKFTANFGPLNNNGGERRLNVAVTRAKERVVVVASFDPDRIDTSNSNARGLADLKKYLKYARGDPHVLERDDSVSRDRLYDSEFEVAVDEALQERGYSTETQIKSSGYSIDLGIRHPQKPGKFVLGIECDGAAYHSSRTARDRDRTRQLILEDLGWDIHRIWSPDWASNREQELTKIDKRVESLLNESDGAGRSSVEVNVESEEPEEEAETDGGTALFAEYTPPTTRFDSSRDFHDIPEYQLKSELQRVVEEHGPIEKEQAFRTVIKSWGVKRLGKRIRNRLDTISNEMIRSEDIWSHEESLCPTSMTTIPVRVNVEDAKRPVEGVPLLELAKLSYMILESGLEIDRDDVILEAARRFGWKRTGNKIKNRVDRAIELLIRINAATRTDNGRLTTTDIDIDEVLLYHLRPE